MNVVYNKSTRVIRNFRVRLLGFNKSKFGKEGCINIRSLILILWQR